MGEGTGDEKREERRGMELDEEEEEVKVEEMK